MNSTEQRPVWRAFIGPMVVALIAFVVVGLTIDAAGDYPRLLEGPGVTLDESFNVQMGVYQWNAIREYHVALLHPDSIREIFGPDSKYNPDHPPLGRVWLGFWHDLVSWLFPPVDHSSLFVTDCARFGSASAFALTIFLIGAFATKWYGRTAGVVAAISLVLMPRLFSHAHIASLETFLNGTYSLTILSVAHWWSKHCRTANAVAIKPTNTTSRADVSVSKIPVSIAILTGVLFGLVLLSKIQAILIPPVVGAWGLWHWRQRAIWPLMVFGVTGLIVLCVGWPWLWLDPLHHLREYFARTTSRAELHCFYLGQVWADKEAPWHYPFVMFAVTVPIGLHLLGLLSLFGRGSILRQPREQLVFAATVFPLILFALPGVAVYDGERLFLVSYPLWGVFIGKGASLAWNWLEQKVHDGRFRALANVRVRVATAVLFFAAQAIGLVTTHPCQLSYYNLLVGGLSGAERLGFERTYWGDSFTRRLLTEVAAAVPKGSTIAVSPVLHQFQLDEILTQSPILRACRIQLIASSDARRQTKVRIAGELIFCRKADLLPNDIVALSDQELTSAPHVGSQASWLAVLRKPAESRRPAELK
jgi:hypothetical protein